MMRIARIALWHLFAAIRIVCCNIILCIGGALKLIWPRAVYLRWLVLGPVGTRKVNVGANAKAKRLAEELMALSRRYEDDLFYGTAVHKGNLILGRVALREEKIEAAKQHLVQAGKTPGSPQLDSFGPNMTLAKELLEIEEREAVLEYFRLCGEFWVLGSSKLGRWTKTVQDGKIPNFGANLHY